MPEFPAPTIEKLGVFVMELRRTIISRSDAKAEWSGVASSGRTVKTVEMIQGGEVVVGSAEPRKNLPVVDACSIRVLQQPRRDIIRSQLRQV
jgi:hypothetical protein